LISENSYGNLLDARKLLQDPANFANQVSESKNQIKLNKDKVDKYWKAIVSKGALNKSEILLEIKNFFEGPINMDFMILGALKNSINKCQPEEEGKEFDVKELPGLLKEQAKDLSSTIMLSQ